MNYAKACADYEFFRGRGFTVSLVKGYSGFSVEAFYKANLAIRAGSETWEIVRGKRARFASHGEMPIRLQSRGSFTSELNARREVLGS